jgi:hypothetical protein
VSTQDWPSESTAIKASDLPMDWDLSVKDTPCPNCGKQLHHIYGLIQLGETGDVVPWVGEPCGHRWTAMATLDVEHGTVKWSDLTFEKAKT